MNERTNISLFLYSVISNNLYPFISIFLLVFCFFGYKNESSNGWNWWKQNAQTENRINESLFAFGKLIFQ